MLHCFTKAHVPLTKLSFVDEVMSGENIPSAHIVRLLAPVLLEHVVDLRQCFLGKLKTAVVRVIPNIMLKI